MDTSKSASAWKGGLLFFSGRRDPVWDVPLDQVKALELLWQSLPLLDEPWSPAPPLGYRGVFLQEADTE